MKRSKHLALNDCILLLFIIYNSQGSLYPQDSSISGISIILIFLISIFYFGKIIFSNIRINNIFKLWTSLFVLNVIGFLLTADFNNSHHIGMIKGILTTSLVFYPFYYFKVYGIPIKKRFLLFFVIILPITILKFYFHKNQVLSTRFDLENIVNNISYFFVALIPYVFLFNRSRILAIGSMIVLQFFIIQGAKRGALLSGLLGLLIFLVYQWYLIPKKNKLIGYLTAFIGLSTLIYFVNDFYYSNEFLINRMERIDEVGGSSGRDIIYRNLFNSWFNSDNFQNLIFGFGFATSLDLSGSGNYAHNDWLELLTNFGLIGVSVYALLVTSVGKLIINKNMEFNERMSLLAIFLIWLMNTLVYRFYTSTEGYLLSILLAYLTTRTNHSLIKVK